MNPSWQQHGHGLDEELFVCTVVCSLSVWFNFGLEEAEQTELYCIKEEKWMAVTLHLSLPPSLRSTLDETSC